MTVETFRDWSGDELRFGFRIEIADGVAKGASFVSAAIFGTEGLAREAGQIAEDAALWDGGVELVFQNGREFERERIAVEIAPELARLWKLVEGDRVYVEGFSGHSETRPRVTMPAEIRRRVGRILSDVERVLDPDGALKLQKKSEGDRRRERRERDAAIVAAVGRGESLRDVGEAYGLTAHRIHAIVRDHAEALGIDYQRVGIEGFRRLMKAKAKGGTDGTV